MGPAAGGGLIAEIVGTVNFSHQEIAGAVGRRFTWSRGTLAVGARSNCGIKQQIASLKLLQTARQLRKSLFQLIQLTYDTSVFSRQRFDD